MTFTNRILRFLDRYERHVSVVTMIGGFFFDLIIASRPDALLVNIFMPVYVVTAALLIVFLAARRMTPHQDLLAPILVLKFCFGGLASNLFILYSKSGTLAGSLLFVLLLGGMLIGNEFFKGYYNRFQFNLAVFYLLLFTYCIIMVPTLVLREIGLVAFLVSGAASFAVVGLLIAAIFYGTSIYRAQPGRRQLITSLSIVGGIFAIFVVLYVTHAIPPVPLALRTIGVYHSITKEGGEYLAQYEPAPRLFFWRDTSATYTAEHGVSAYCFSSVFAPTGLSTPIRHRWEVYSAATDTWSTAALIPFSISGGRDEGYRGFSIKSRMSAGKWRCSVETVSGTLIGRFTFTVVESTTTPELIETRL